MSAPTRIRSPWTWALVSLPLVFLGYFFFYPLLSIVISSLTPEGNLDLSPFSDVLTSSSLLGVAWFTLWQAAASTVLTLIAALPVAYVLARYQFPGKRILRALITVPFVLPTVVVGSAFVALLGSRSPLGIDLTRTIWIILLAHLFYNFAVVVRTVGGLWSHIDPRIEEAARSLGASRWQAFREVTLPLLRPALAAASSIVFLFSFTSFGVILILGELRFATLEVEIFRQTKNFLNLGVAAALAVLQLIAVTIILWAYSRYQERRAVSLSLRPEADVARRPTSRQARLAVAGTFVYVGVLLGAPLILLIQRSFSVGGSLSLEFYRALGESRRGSVAFISPMEAIGNSLWIALVATVVALAVGISAALVIASKRSRASRFFDVLLMLPLGTSAVTIGFGMLVALDWPVDLRTWTLLIPIGHALVAIPFVVRIAVPVLRSIRPELRQAAAVLGASPRTVWRELELPIAARAMAVSGGFAFAISLGEFGATSFIARADTPTLPIAIFRFLGQPGAINFGQAMAMSTILMVVTGLAILAVDRFRVGQLGEF